MLLVRGTVSTLCGASEGGTPAPQQTFKRVQSTLRCRRGWAAAAAHAWSSTPSGRNECVPVLRSARQSLRQTPSAHACAFHCVVIRLLCRVSTVVDNCDVNAPGICGALLSVIAALFRAGQSDPAVRERQEAIDPTPTTHDTLDGTPKRAVSVACRAFRCLFAGLVAFGHPSRYLRCVASLLCLPVAPHADTQRPRRRCKPHLPRC